jgi:hypothetical protein
MVIRHVGVWSVSRLYGALSAAIGLLFGVCFALVAMLGGMTGAMRDSGSGLGSGGPFALFGVSAIILFPIFYGVLGLLGGAIGAALYNLFAGMLGGVELETEP